MPDAWLQILKNDRIGAFRLTYFYEYKFPENLANVEMNLDDFVVPQCGQNIYGYNLQTIYHQTKQIYCIIWSNRLLC